MVITDFQLVIAMFIADSVALLIVIISVGGINEFLRGFVEIRDVIKDWKNIPKRDIIREVRSCEDEMNSYNKFLEELQMCYEKQFTKLKDIDDVWGDLHDIVREEEYGSI